VNALDGASRALVERFTRSPIRRMRALPDPGGSRIDRALGSRPPSTALSAASEEKLPTSDTFSHDVLAPKRRPPPGLHSSPSRQRRRFPESEVPSLDECSLDSLACAKASRTRARHRYGDFAIPARLPTLFRPNAPESTRLDDPAFRALFTPARQSPRAARRLLPSTAIRKHEPSAFAYPARTTGLHLSVDSAYRYQVRETRWVTRVSGRRSASAVEASWVRGLVAMTLFGVLAGSSRRDGSRRELCPNPMGLGHLMSPVSSAPRRESPWSRGAEGHSSVRINSNTRPRDPLARAPR